jgi:hypothetical protein
VLPLFVTIRFLWLRLEPPKVVESERPVVPERKTGNATLPPVKSVGPFRLLRPAMSVEPGLAIPPSVVEEQRSASINQKAGLKSCNALLLRNPRQCWAVAACNWLTGR